MNKIKPIATKSADMILATPLLGMTKDKLNKFEKDDLVKLLNYIRYKLNGIISKIYNTKIMSNEDNMDDYDKEHLIYLLLLLKNEVKKL